MSKKMRVDVTTEELQQMLVGHLNSATKPQIDTIAKCIIHLLEDRDNRMGILFKTIMGVTPVMKYKVGDDIVVRQHALGAYGMDEKKTAEAGLFKDGNLRCKIEAVHEFAEYPYKVVYKYIEDDDRKRSSTSDVREDDIKGYYEVIPDD